MEKFKDRFPTSFKKKKTPNGSQADQFSKKYYLNDALQFLMPFIKSGRKRIGNITAPQSNTEIRDVNIFDDVSENEYSNQTVNVEVEAVHDKSISPSILNTSSNNISLQKSKKKYVFKETDVDRCFIEYFNNKKQKTKDSSADEKFLLGLLPYVEQMNQSQKGRFKREVMAVIDSIFKEPSTSKPSTSHTYSSQSNNATLPNTAGSYKGNDFEFLKF